jgi:hypothetical protein
LLGDIGRRPRTAGRIEDEIAWVGGQQDAAFYNSFVRLDDINLIGSTAEPIPPIGNRFEGEIFEVPFEIETIPRPD